MKFLGLSEPMRYDSLNEALTQAPKHGFRQEFGSTLDNQFISQNVLGVGRSFERSLSWSFDENLVLLTFWCPFCSAHGCEVELFKANNLNVFLTRVPYQVLLQRKWGHTFHLTAQPSLYGWLPEAERPKALLPVLNSDLPPAPDTSYKERSPV